MPSRRADQRPHTPPRQRAAAGTDQRAGDRIAKLLARAGVASRREIERMIAEGRVALDGTPLTTPATLLSSLRGVTVDGHPVEEPAPARLFLYHKPTGLLVAERDPKGRPTIYDRLPGGLPRVVPVGRLDLNTEGLLLLTTDGGFKRQLELPATGVERAYRARAYGTVTQAQLEALVEGIEIDGIRYGPIDANIERRTGANVWIELVLTEGKNREVRRVLEHLGLQVSRLIRTRYGPFVLGDLPLGEVGEVRERDLVAFRRTLKGGAPDELPAPRAGFRTPPSADRARRTVRQPSEEIIAVAPSARPGGMRPRAATGDAAPQRHNAAPARPSRASAPRGDEADRSTRDPTGRPQRSHGAARPAPSPARQGGARGRAAAEGRSTTPAARTPRPAAPKVAGRSASHPARHDARSQPGESDANRPRRSPAGSREASDTRSPRPDRVPTGQPPRSSGGKRPGGKGPPRQRGR